MAKSNRVAVLAEDIRPFTVLREIKHEGQRYKEGDTIDLTHDEWVEMHGDGRVAAEGAGTPEPITQETTTDGGNAGGGGTEGAGGA